MHGPRVDTELRASTPGVFTAGNLLRGAETAEFTALEERDATHSIKAFLERGAWPERVLPLQVEAPIAWVSSNVVSIPSNGCLSLNRFTFRVSEFCRQVKA